MAINSQKFLPSIKTSSAILRSVGSTNKSKKDSSNSIRKELLLIKDKLIKINSVVKSTFLLQKENDKNTKNQTENKKFLEKEKRLENKKQQKEFKMKDNIIPQMGIMDRINRFITFTLLGFLVNKFFKYLPDILEFTKKIGPVVNFIESFVGSVFKGFVDFIDLGYKTYDKVRDFTKTVGGENFQKTFDDFSKNLNTFVNLAIIAGMATMGGTDFGLGKKGGKVGRPGRPGRPGRGGRLPGSPLRKPENNLMRRYFQRYGREKFIQRFGEAGLESLPGGMRRGLLQRGARSVFMGIAGKSGAKQILKLTRVFTKSLPIIGGLVDFGLSVAMGEPLGRAAFKAIGAGILGAIGTGFGGPLGAILGGFAGDWAGGKLYDIFFGGQKNVDDKTKVIKKQSGGKLSTRKGKTVGGAIKRTVRRTISSPKATKVIPGSDVGGEKAIQKMFPESTGNNVGKTVNPFGFLTNTTNSMGEIPFFGPLFSLFGKILLGQFPNKTDYRTIGLGINAWINNAISKGYLQGNLMKGFADGGIIDNDMMRDISGWVEKSVEELVKNKVTEAINDLRRNLGMEPLSGESAYGTQMQGGFSPTGIQKDIYEYLLSKGLDDNKALGIMANIHRESGFRPGASQSGGPGVGLFQYSSAGRKDAFLKAVPDYATNWKGQIDYALNEDKAPQYLQMQFSSPEEAADWWMREWERPAQYIQTTDGPRIHREYLASVPKSKGGRPMFPSGIQLGSDQGNLQAAKDLASNMRLQMTSAMYNSDGTRRTGLHGAGRAMDFSNSTGPTPEMMNYANQMISKYGSSLKQLIYTPLGYGIADGKKVPLSYWGESTNNEHYNHVHVAFKDGGIVSPDKKTRNIKSIQSQASYDDMGSVVFIQPVIITKYTPIPTSNSSINFGSSGSVNTNNKVTNLFAR